MKRIVFSVLAGIFVISAAYGEDDKFVITTSTQQTPKSQYLVTHACEWYRNSSDRTMIYLELSPGPVLQNETWWGTPENESIKKTDTYTTIYAGIVDAFKKYNTPTQQANIDNADINRTLIIPDSIFVDCPPGQKMRNFYTDEETDRIGFPVTYIYSGAFSPLGSDGIYYYESSYVDPIHAKVGTGEFLSFTGFKKIVLPPQLNGIKSQAFYGSSIEEINLENVVTIERRAFKDCKKLKKVDLSRLRYAGEDAFEGAVIDTLILRNGFHSDVPAVFRNTSIKYLDWDNANLTRNPKISNYYSSYYESNYENYISTVKIGDNATTIPMDFCYGMPTLKKLTIGKSIRTISSYAFINTGLQVIYSYAVEPPVLNGSDGSAPFYGVAKSSCVLYVPSGCGYKYEGTPIWRDFIIREMDAGIEDVASDDVHVIKTEYYDLYGRKTDNPQRGQFVVRADHLSDGTVKSSKFVIR